MCCGIALKEIPQDISGEVGNLTRTEDGTNKIGTCPKGLTSAKVILYFLGVRLDYFNRLWDYPEGGSSNPGPGSGVREQ